MTTEYYQSILLYLKNVIQGTEFEGRVYAVGGCVRDFIMEEPIKDIDLVVSLEDGGIRFAEWMEQEKRTSGSVVTYPTYGTAMFKLAEFPDVEIECVQTRKEQYKDKTTRNPETAYGSLEEDIYRRDFTINSLLWNISSEKLLDITGNGIKDIQEHRIRVTSSPEIIFDDDSLRELRCIRFWARFHSDCSDWYIEEETMQGMKDSVERLSIITKERIQDELNKMLLCKDPVSAIRLIYEIGAMKYVIPELEEAYTCEQNKYHVGTVFEHTMKVLDNVVNKPLFDLKFSEKDTLALRMAALLHDIGKIKTKTIGEDGRVHFYKHEEASYELTGVILRRLKYSNDFIHKVQFLVRNHMLTKNWGDDLSHMKDKSLRKFQYRCKWIKAYMLLLSLIDADNNAHAEGYCLPHQCTLIDERTESMISEGTDMFHYVLPIDGNDVMEVKDIEQGKEVKECLDYALKIAFNKPNIDKEELLKHIKGYKLKKKQ